MGGIFKRKIKNKKSKKSKEMPFLVCTVVFGASRRKRCLMHPSMLLVVTLACGDFEKSNVHEWIWWVIFSYV
jgi:hypothetical protein